MRAPFLAVMLLLHGGQAATLSAEGPYMGLFERATTGVFMAGMVAIYALWRMQAHRRGSPGGRREVVA